MGTRVRTTLVAVAAMVTTASVLACSSGDDDDSTPVITDPVETTDEAHAETTTTEDPDADVKADVEAAYLAYGSAFLEIFANPDPNNPLIDKFTTGPVRDELLDAVSRDIANGHSVRPPENPADYSTDVREVSIDGKSATLSACLIDGSRVVENSTGNLLNDTVVTLLVKVGMRYEGAWKVETSFVIEEREGRWDCESS